jgi:cytochrome c
MTSKLIAAFVVVLTIWGFGPSRAQGTFGVGDAENGAVVFRRCMTCHQIGESAQPAIGPPLNRVVGRKAAAISGYRYSASLAEAGLVWTAPTLALFLESPRKLVPGTSMAFLGLAKKQDILDVIAYLNVPRDD